MARKKSKLINSKDGIIALLVIWLALLASGKSRDGLIWDGLFRIQNLASKTVKNDAVSIERMNNMSASSKLAWMVIGLLFLFLYVFGKYLVPELFRLITPNPMLGG